VSGRTDDGAGRREVNIGPNEVLRFVLELAALAAMAFWGWTSFDGPVQWLAAIGVPLAAAAIWGVFRVPGDPGPAPVAVPGAIRLALEIAFFTVAALLLFAAGAELAAAIFAALVAFHYTVGRQRIAWLLGQH
jgi:hypothetical protein